MIGFPLKACRRLRVFAAVGIGCLVLGAAPARAQVQESGTLDRITHPDRTLHYGGADREFTVSSNVAGRQAVVKPFAYNHGADLRGGDGSFRTRAFASKDKFQTPEFSTRPAATRDFSARDKGFGTKSMAVKEDRAAQKAMPIHGYVPGERAYLGRGKRQDDLDDLYRQKNLDINQVRQLLNKPGGSTDAPYQRISEGTVPRAQAVTAPNAR